MLRRLICIPSGEEEPPALPPVTSGTPGPDAILPPLDIQLVPLDHSSTATTQTGPDGGVQPLQACTPDLVLPWGDGSPTAYGEAISLYDCTSTGARNGEPVADCFGIITYTGPGPGAIMAVADGVGWGEPPRRAARCAVLGALNHLHTAMATVAKEHSADPSSKLMSSVMFQHMLEAMHAAQALILRQMGTLTTLVLSVIQPQAPTCSHYSHKVNSKRTTSSKRKLLANSSLKGGTGGEGGVEYDSWAVMSLTVGDSSAWLWRSQPQMVQELTAASHHGDVRNARFVPGALGHALGEDPDLANLTLSITLASSGDVVFLGSDGIGDNFNPHMLQISRPMTTDSLMHASDDDDESCANLPPAMSPSQVQDRHVELLAQAIMSMQSGGGTGGSGTPKTRGQAKRCGSNGRLQDCGQLGCSAQQLVKGLLTHVNEATEALREATAEKARAAETRSTLARDLGTDGPKVSKMPPGKLDHATVLAYQLGSG